MFKFPYKMIAIDLETTDVDPVKGSIIQIGAIALDKELNIIGEFNKFIAPLDKHRNPEAMKVNQISESTLQSASNLHQILGLFEAFTGSITQLSAWGAHFDLPFLKKQYEKIGREYSFSYRHFDLKSVALWEMAKKGQPVVSGVKRFLKMNNIEFDGNTHDALADIKNTVKLIKYFISDKKYGKVR